MKRFYFVGALLVMLAACGEAQESTKTSADVAVDDFIVYTDDKTTDSSKFDSVYASAMRGNYQAQRNLAYGYSAAPYPGQQINPILACAWRIVILESGDELIDGGDVSNYKVDCNLDDASQSAAQAQASQILNKIDDNLKSKT